MSHRCFQIPKGEGLIFFYLPNNKSSKYNWITDTQITYRLQTLHQINVLHFRNGTLVELKRGRRYVALLTESLCLNGTQERTLLWITIQCKDELTSNKLSITSLTCSPHIQRVVTQVMCVFCVQLHGQASDTALWKRTHWWNWHKGIFLGLCK